MKSLAIAPDGGWVHGYQEHFASFAIPTAAGQGDFFDEATCIGNSR